MKGRNPLDNPDMSKLYAALDPLLDALERYRLGHLFFMLIICLFFTPLTYVFTLALGLLMFGQGFAATLSGITAAALVVLVIYRIFDRDYRRMCKRRYNRQFAKVLDMKYEPMGTFMVEDIADHYVLPRHIRGLPQDSLTMIHKGRTLRMQEVVFNRADALKTHIYNPLSFGGPRGLIFRIPSRRTFILHTLVVPQRLVASDRDKLRFPGLVPYKRTPFGNRRFNEKYFVLAEDALEAHLVFDPAFIERLLAFEKAIGARSLSLSFFKNEIVIFADHAHDFLEAGHLFRRVTLARADDILEDLRTLTGLVDTLELNEFTGV